VNFGHSEQRSIPSRKHRSKAVSEHVSCIRYPRHNYTIHKEHDYDYSFHIPFKIDVISVGSTKRDTLQAAQNATFGRHMRKMFFVTEETFPHCVECPKEHKDLFHDGPFRAFEPFAKGIDWQCAQQRNLQALRYTVDSYKNNFSEVDWVALIDDDTYLNPVALSRSLYVSLEPRVIGHSTHGGAGFFFNAVALKQLQASFAVKALAWKAPADDRVENELDSKVKNTLRSQVKRSADSRSSETAHWSTTSVHVARVVDQCVAKQLGGSWCGYHSDWVVGACVKAANITLSKFDGGAMFQSSLRCSADEQSPHSATSTATATAAKARHYNRQWMREALVSTHHLTPEDMYDQYVYVLGPEDAGRGPDRD